MVAQKRKFKQKSKREPLIIKHSSFLNFLHDASPVQRRELIKLATKGQIRSVCECAYNIVKRNIDLSEEDVKKLRKYRNILYKICDPQTPVSDATNILSQKGGAFFLPALLAPIIGSLIGSAIS